MVRKLSEAFFILLITAALFLFCEGTLRAIYPKKVKRIKHEPEKLAFVYNPRYLVALKPSAERVFRRPLSEGGNIKWQTNRQSFRGPELREHPGFRVIVYGDSNVQAVFTSLENTFPCRLERRLRQFTHRDVEVINAGVMGFGPDQCLIRFSEEVDVYHPNLVIFVVFADNDFGDLIRNRLFDLDASGGLVQTGFKTVVDQTLRRRPFQNFLENILLVSAATKFWKIVTRDHPTILETLLSISEREYQVYAAHRPRFFSHFADHYDADLALFPTSAAAKTKVALMNAVLRKAKQLADSKRVDFMVMIEPSSRDLTTNLDPDYRNFLAYPEYKRNNLSSFVEQICIENHIPYVNLYDPFMKNSPNNLYFKGKNDHWNDAGQDLASQEAAKFIAARQARN